MNKEQKLAKCIVMILFLDRGRWVIHMSEKRRKVRVSVIANHESALTALSATKQVKIELEGESCERCSRY